MNQFALQTAPLRLLAILSLGLTLAACSPESPTTTAAKMHPSWDTNGDGINDCERAGNCDHTVDYTKARSSAADVKTNAADKGSLIRLHCDDDSVISIRYQGKDAELLSVTRNGKHLELARAVSASGAKYESNGTIFWEHQGEAYVTWKETDEELVCRPEE
jgi:membrane-bound inhibitor of C-type lysozyme